MTTTKPDLLALPPTDGATANPPLDPDAAEAWVDEALAPFRSFVGALTATAEPLDDERAGMRLFIEALRVSLPFEMDVLVEDSGRLRLAGGPPACYTETSVMPVFHQLSVRMESEASDG